MNIFVGNLSREVTEQELHDAFVQFGEISSHRIIKDRFSGEARGFGFVEMPSKEEAEKAIASMNGTELKGKVLTVNEAKPREPRSQGGAGGFSRNRNFSRGGNRDRDSRDRGPRRSW